MTYLIWWNLMLMLVMTLLPRIEVGDVDSSVLESGYQLEWYSSSPRVGSSVGENASSPWVGSIVGDVVFEPPSLIGVEPLSQIAGHGVRTKLLCWPSGGKITLSGQWRGRRIRSTKVRTLGGRVLEWVDVIIARCMTASSLNLGRWCQPVSPN
jgi:hypothetical protein